MTTDALSRHQILSDRDFLDQFERAELDKSLFNHTGHLRAAFLFLQREPMLLAQRHYTAALKRYAESLGAPEKFHATITYAILAIMSARQGVQRCASWREFIQRNPDLANHADQLLNQYYHLKTLQSDEAKKSFVLPDKATLAKMISASNEASAVS
ncbi:hypothetical protein [Permianibacter aggregans]|uniref:Uncharacterized protein n=2 Tax=Permianibacter aggregans TaxID=1510150 RepID=A0A4R6USD1_9GAMM|nr:hypothetical protein [Permianibacter aggregans]QGX40022.1 hypothetical protein E2H98_10240 [Permianibacter aggregans]TDQ49166.1 hypothetical protein EV696_105140 [Permianibacter aggregans]